MYKRVHVEWFMEEKEELVISIMNIQLQKVECVLRSFRLSLLYARYWMYDISQADPLIRDHVWNASVFSDILQSE